MKNDEFKVLLSVKSEKAFKEIYEKYFPYCYKVAFNILGNKEDAEECALDSFSKMWARDIPENIGSVKLYLAKITRNAAIDRMRSENAVKRGMGNCEQVLSELDSITGSDNIQTDFELALLGESITRFLGKQKDMQRCIFVRRYFYGESITEIADKYSLSENNVSVILLRIRKKLKKHLEKEEFI